MQACYDIEVFPDTLIICFLDCNTGKYHHFLFHEGEEIDTEPLQTFIRKIDELIGFNILSYDNVIVNEFLNTGSVIACKKLNDFIISGRSQASIELSPGDIDLFRILDCHTSLKHYQALMGLKNIKESSVSFESRLKEDRESLCDALGYCQYDIWSTFRLYKHPTTQDKILAKRVMKETYDLNTINDPDSHLSSCILAQEIKKILGLGQKASLKVYNQPVLQFFGKEIINPKIKFNSQAFQASLEKARIFEFAPGKKFEYQLPCQDFIINLGQGGMHSVGKSRIISSLNGEEKLIDYDVSSFYPGIILTEEIGPDGFKEAFLEVYKRLTKARLQAKKAGNKARANSEKLVINSAFGKFKSKQSFLYNPKSLLQVTLNCQFKLLQLIEEIQEAGIEIIQVNTDGVLTYVKSKLEEELLLELVIAWSAETMLEMEATYYSKLIMKDANNYVAIKTDGKKKEKGKPFITERNLTTGGSYPLILSKGIQAYFFEGIEPEKFVKEALGEKRFEDFFKFAKRDEFISPPDAQRKINRWIYGKNIQNSLRSKSRGGREKTDDTNIYILNNLNSNGIIKELDAERYISEIKTAIQDLKNNSAGLKALAAYKKEQAKNQPDLFTELHEKSNQIHQELKEQKKNIKPPFIDKALLKRRRIELIKFYKSNRLPLLALTPGEKKPYIRNWQTLPQEALYKKIKETDNLGLRLDDFAVIDIDDPEVAKIKMTINIPDTLICYRAPRSPEGIKQFREKGHIYFKRPVWLNESFRAIEELGIELRVGSGVQNAIPPSRHPDGSIYEWNNIELLKSLPEFTEELYNFITSHLKQSNSSFERDERTRKEATELFYRKEEILDEILVKARGFKKEEQGDYTHKGTPISKGINYYNYCPQAEKHSQKAGNSSPREFLFHLSYSGRITKHCHHSHCKDIWKVLNHKLLKLSDIELKLFYSTKELETRLTIDQIQPLSSDQVNFYDKCTIPELINIINTLGEKEDLFVEGYTGVGKTYNCIKALLDGGAPSTVLMGTIPQAYKAVSIFKTHSTEDQITLEIAGNSEEEEEDTLTGGSGSLKRYTVSTYGYIGRAGETSFTYDTAKKLLENRRVFCDEIQLLFHKSKVSHSFSARYRLITSAEANQGTYEILKRCPRKAGSGNCKNCIPFYKKQTPRSPNYTRNFYNKFDQESAPVYAAKPSLGVISWNELIDFHSYEQIQGTLFRKKLQFQENFELEESNEKKSSYVEFLKDLTSKMIGPEIRTELTVFRNRYIELDDLDEIPEQSLEKLKFPIYSCQTPVLFGIDALPYLQLMKYSRNLIFSSATLPEDFMKLYTGLAEKLGRTVKFYKINEIPAKFNACILKTDLAISLDRLKSIILKLHQATEEKTLIITNRKGECEKLYSAIAQTIPGAVKQFHHRDYANTIKLPVFLSRQNDTEDKHLITYALSGITSSIDMPDRSILIVDCQQFLPQSSLLGLNEYTTEEEKHEILCNAIRENLLQICGRLLRSKDREPGKTIQDTRRLVILLHGLPEELKDFKLPEELFYKYEEFKNWINPVRTKFVPSVVETILTCLEEEEPEDQQKIYETEITETYLQGDISKLNINQRKALDINKAKKQKQTLKLLRKVEQGKELKKQGFTNRDIYQKLHMTRWSEDEKNYFWSHL